MTTIAVLNDTFYLIGYRKLGKKAKVPEGAIVVPDGCDLPADGSYKWVAAEECFLPLGHGFGKPERAPVPDVQVLYLLAMAMDNPPAEVSAWAKWYEKNLKQAHEEMGHRPKG